MAESSKNKGKANPITMDVPHMEGVSPALVAFLVRLEAKIDARFDDIEDQMKTFGSRLDDAQKSLRKLRRMSIQDSNSASASIAAQSQPMLSQRSADSLSSRSRSRAVRPIYPLLPTSTFSTQPRKV
jgi:hypothetical protein